MIQIQILSFIELQVEMCKLTITAVLLIRFRRKIEEV